MHSPMFSLEVFPPKRTSPVGTIYDTLDGLQGLDPDFISVTYGTGKSSDRTLTARIAHTVGEFGVVLMIGGNIPEKTRVVSVQIYDHVEALEYAQAHWLAGAMLVFSFVVLLALYSSRRSQSPWG